MQTDIVIYLPHGVQLWQDVKNFRTDDEAAGDRRRIFFDWKCDHCDKIHHMTFFGAPYLIDVHETHVEKSKLPTAAPGPTERVN